MSGTTPKQFSRDKNSRNDKLTRENSVLEPGGSQAQRPQDDTTLEDDADAYHPRDVPAPAPSDQGSPWCTSPVNPISDGSSAYTDTSRTSVTGTRAPATIVQGTNAHQSLYKFYIGIFSSNANAARRFKQRVEQLYSVCIYTDWSDCAGDPLAEKCVHFINNCMLLFWIASPDGDTKYMKHLKNVAHDDSIAVRPYRSFIVVIPREHLDMPLREIVPRELCAYEPLKEDNLVVERIKSTVEHVLTKCQGCVNVSPSYSLSAQHQEQPEPFVCAEPDQSTESDLVGSDQQPQWEKKQKQKQKQQHEQDVTAETDLDAKPSHVTYNIDGANTVVISNDALKLGSQVEMEQHVDRVQSDQTQPKQPMKKEKKCCIS